MVQESNLLPQPNDDGPQPGVGICSRDARDGPGRPLGLPVGDPLANPRFIPAASSFLVSTLSHSFSCPSLHSALSASLSPVGTLSSSASLFSAALPLLLFVPAFSVVLSLAGLLFHLFF
ncbi:hypothetical protein M9H77_27978 [Catharanthus roseus]|uniref:Uncharacterized protein n=1 Tax=Catharanthus roseus TaxID=4058 RepID=A0ACC0AE84_CATRO|nr:hypothetical protein M9H77_27978 [Catharanthus roseus]